MGISSLPSLTQSKNVQYSAPERARASMHIVPSSSQIDSPLTQIALNSVQLEEIISLHQEIAADPLLTKHDSPLSPIDKEALIQAIFQKILTSSQEIKWDSLDHDALIRLKDSEGMNIFLIATQEGNGECLEKLIQELGYERLISAKDSSGRNALHLAAIYGHTHLIDLFISRGDLSPQDQDASHLTPLHWAIHEGQLESLQKLLRCSSIGDSWTPPAYPDLHISTLALAVASGHHSIISLLLSHNTFNQLNLLEPIASFGTIFHLIIHANQSHALQLLMGNHEQMKELFEAKDFAERTPLQLAAFLGDLAAIHTLVKGGCLINQGSLDPSGTPLLFAAKGEKPEAIQLLITLGGDPQLSDKNGLTPLQYLKQQKELSYPGIRCKKFLENIQHTIKLGKIKAVRMGERLPVNLVLDSFSQQKVIYQGLIQALEKKKILSELSRISGKGMGAVIATLIACGYTAQDLEEKLPHSLISLFSSEESHEEGELSLGVKELMLQEEANIETFVSKRCDQPFYDHTRFQQEIDNLIFEKIGLENCTFGDLAVKVRENPFLYKHLHLFITSVQEQKIIRITSEDIKWKDVTISSALTASLAFPKIFSPVTLLGKNIEGDLDSLFHSKTYTAPPRAQLIVDAFDDECYQEDPYFKGRKTNDRTLCFSIHEELENMPAFQEAISAYLLRYLMQSHQRQTMKNIQESSYGRAMILNLSKGSESEEDLMTLSQTLAEEHLSKVSISSIQHSKASTVFSLVKVPTPWKYRLFLEAPQIYTPPTPVKKGKYEDLPSLPLSFIERNQEFESIVEAFKRHSKVAISGLGGVGKSTLAMKYGHAYREHYEFTLFAKVSSEVELIEKLLELAKGLKIIEEKPEDTLKILKAKLHRMTNPYFFIIDGFDHEELFPLLKKYLPETSKCKILMTTRIGFTAEVEGFYKIELKSFKPEEAMSYLLQGKECQGANQEKESVKQITHELGYLPLALAHAAGYIKRQNISFESYHTLLKKYHLELFHEKNIKIPQGERSILTTWHISIDAITKMPDGDLAKELMERIACLGEGLIPFPLLEAWLSLSELKKDELDLRRALEHLMNYSLINFQKEKISKTPFYAVHSLVQQAVKHQLNSDEKKKKSSEMTDALDTELNRLRKADEYERAVLIEYGVHAAFILATDAFKDDFLLKNKVVFIANTSAIYYKLCSFDKALKYAQEGLDIQQKVYGEESPYTAESYEAVGSIFRDLGRLEEALKVSETALKIKQKAYGEESGYTAESYELVGSIFKDLGRLEEALKVSEIALKIKQKVYGEESPYTAESYQLVGSIFKDLGRLEEALKVSEIALKIKQKVYGEESPYTAESYQLVGSIFQDLGRLEEALKVSETALKIKQKVLGEESPYTVASYQLVGRIFQDLGRLEEAFKVSEIALKIKQKVHGEESPYTAASYELVGSIFKDLGRLEEALKVSEIALKIKQKVLGEESPYTAASYELVGSIFKDLGRLEEALKVSEIALKIKQKVHGEESPYTAEIYELVGSIFKDLGRLEEALKVSEIALKIKQKVYGEESPYTAESYQLVGSIFKDLGRLEEALKVSETALKIKQKIYVEESPYAAASYQVVGEVLSNLKSHEEALNMSLIALDMTQKSLGKKSRYTAESFEALGKVLKNAGNFEKALNMSCQALTINQEIFGEISRYTAASYQLIGMILKELKRNDEALQMCKKALDINCKVYGEASHHTVKSKEIVESVLKDLSIKSYKTTD